MLAGYYCSLFTSLCLCREATAVAGTARERFPAAAAELQVFPWKAALGALGVFFVKS